MCTDTNLVSINKDKIIEFITIKERFLEEKIKLC